MLPDVTDSSRPPRFFPSSQRRMPPVWRRPGDTARLDYGQFHRIIEVSPDGCYTLFLTWRYRGKWGFWVNGCKMPHDEYRP